MSSMKTYQEIAKKTQEEIFHKLKDELEEVDRLAKERGELADRMLSEIRDEVISRLGVVQVNEDPSGPAMPLARPPRKVRASLVAKPLKKAKLGAPEKRSPAELALACKQFLTAVKAHPGERMEQLRLGLGGETKDWVLPAKKLLGEKKIRTKGQKRATAYFPK